MKMKVSCEIGTCQLKVVVNFGHRYVGNLEKGFKRDSYCRCFYLQELYKLATARSHQFTAFQNNNMLLKL